MIIKKSTRIETRAGLVAAITSNLLLGLSSLYWKALGELSSIALLGYRVLFSLMCVTLVLAAFRKLKPLLLTIKLKDLLLHGAAALLVACNWGTFIWASIHGRVLESGLGYLIAPMLEIGLGLVFYREPISVMRGSALALVVLSILFLFLSASGLDYRIYLIIGLTWGMYAWLKKMTRLAPMGGLFVESLLLTFLVGASILYFDGLLTVPEGLTLTAWSLLIGCGLVSLIPLALFAFAAKRLPLSAMGLLQFILPLTQFCVAAIFYDQAVPIGTFLAFATIALALLLVILEPLLKNLLRVKGVA
ncbi:EamA family transporter [Pseudomonas sp. LP_7_YM]|uniref:EamA family transporter n=1 Tax=Pseudomonas sp. LP_7_YM TaxID=2485137 RepID=UPI00105E015B|nr:rarD protein [Pseudomonas sp. LP_7_YM]TDV70121.1 chloramphenicol-sensitive protein RarD [Pseudomonas sp. LP_7_YM]